MEKIIFLTVISILLHLTAFSQSHQPDYVKAHRLDEVVVESSYITRENDHILAVPTKEQRRHAVSGYDLLRNLMIPGISVNRTSGIVNTPAGNATVYIDGREAEFREVQSLRPKDIASVEYYDLPSGVYAKDAAAINFILKKQENGGYTQIDALQGLGFLSGDYNLISKYVTGTKSINLWGGYSLENPKSSIDEQETFSLEDNPLRRETVYKGADNKAADEYVQASISNRGNKYIWMLRGGMSWKDDRDNAVGSTVSYGIFDSAFHNPEIVGIASRNKTLRPSVYFYGLHTISDTKSLDYVIDSYYSRNDYNRSYEADENSYCSTVKENYWYTKINANYSMALSRQNRLAFMLYEFLRISDSDYFGVSEYSQNLHSSETILFADYSQRLGSFFYDINPGVSFLTYRLKGMKSINHLTPRLQARMAYMIDRRQQFQFAFALGNTYPRINTINNVEQQIDPIIILKGNPDMDNSILLSPCLSYNLNLNKFGLELGTTYFYQDHTIIADYHVRDGHLISTFRDDCVYHKPSADISMTYKPSNSLNMQLSGEWSRHMTRGGAEHRNLSSLSGSASLNYYIGDFSISAWLSTPTRDLVDCQIRRKTFWQYQLSAMWNRGNWAIEASANNLFLMKNRFEDEIITAVYSINRTNWNRMNNQYATIKVVYCFDYGKKTSKSPKYQHTVSESAILK
ncbi:MAG: hypothetical protein K2K75_09430 [Muribaculaceae bacterium]|nr:hypothetical protein [Muribaculaceae bacterium]